MNEPEIGNISFPSQRRADPDGKKYYYLFDGLGSIVAMTDGTGKEVNPILHFVGKASAIQMPDGACTE